MIYSLSYSAASEFVSGNSDAGSSGLVDVLAAAWCCDRWGCEEQLTARPLVDIFTATPALTSV